jgi:hypothetical protein
LVVLCLSSLELLLLLLLDALSGDFVLVLLVLPALLVNLVTLLFEVSVPFLLSGAPVLLPKAICLSFLSVGYKTLLFEHGFTIETGLLLSAQLFVETNLLLSCTLLLQAPLFLDTPLLLLQAQLFLKELLLLEASLFLEALLPLQLLLASLFESLVFLLPLRLSL